MKARSVAIRLMAWFLMLGSLTGCDGPVVPTGSPALVPLAVQTSTSGGEMVEVIAIEVTGAGIPVPIIVNLEVVDGTASGTVTVPAGSDRTFTGRGFDATRDKLVGLLWPERDDERARHLLSQSLYVLRGAVGEDAVLSTGDSHPLVQDPGR
jgi:hypothetical protein